MKNLFLILVSIAFGHTLFAEDMAQDQAYMVELIAKQEVGGQSIESIANQFEQVIKEAESNGWKVEVERENKTAYVLFSKRNNESIAQTVVNETKGCEAFNHKCISLIRKKNRFAPDVLKHDYSGELIIPAASIEYRIKIFAGSEHTVTQQGNTVVAEISPRLSALTRSVSQYQTMGYSEFCINEDPDSCTRFKTVIKD